VIKPVDQSFHKLIKACIVKKRRAQGRLYGEFAPFVLAVIRRYGIPNWEEGDILQVVFVEVFDRLGQYDATKGKFTTWLRSITVFRIIDAQRKKSRLQFTTLEIVPDAVTEETDLRKEIPEYLLRMIGDLPEGYRMVFNLFAVDGYSHLEIADLLGISPEGARSQYYRARQALQRMLKSEAIKKKLANVS